MSVVTSQLLLSQERSISGKADQRDFTLQFTQGIHRALQIHPDAVATICDGRLQTFTGLAERVARAAGALLNLGVRAGDRVAVLSFNSDRVLENYLAVAWIAGVVNPINFRWSAEEIAFGLKDSDSCVLFVDDAFAPYAEQLMSACPKLRAVIHCGEGAAPAGCLSLEDLIAAHAAVPDVGAGGEDIFGLFYTGGTTGTPKGVLLTHSAILGSALGIIGEGAFKVGAVGLHSAPMFHLADFMMMSCLLLRGGTHVMLRAFRPDVALGLVAAHGITDLLVVPTMLQALIDHPGFGDADLTSIRSILYGAAPASEAVIDRAMRALPTVAFAQVYGMTETAATISMLRASDHTPEHRAKGRWRSAGRSFCHTRIRIVDLNGVPCATGEVGEITVRGPNVMMGYFNRPIETRDAFRTGWLHTGDLGYLDEAGYLFIVDRAKDMIITGGENVFSVEVEAAIATHPSVTTCAVIGIPDSHWGESVHAIVVLKPGAQTSQDELIAHARGLIAHFKCPKSISIVTELPISGAGKILKTELRKPFWEGKERAVN
jgi:acyl-CoA synthetase (AMP-forming)/AMP-acid ligase II